jgi:hypothetical protein
LLFFFYSIIILRIILYLSCAIDCCITHCCTSDELTINNTNSNSYFSILILITIAISVAITSSVCLIYYKIKRRSIVIPSNQFELEELENRVYRNL